VLAAATVLAGCGALSRSPLRIEPLATGEAPVLGRIGDDLIVSRDDHVERVTPTGELRWRSPVRGQWLVDDARPDAIVVGPHDEHYRQPVVRIDLRDGRVLSRASVEWRLGLWYRRGEALYTVKDDQAERIDPVTGAVRWRVDGELSERDVLVGPDAIWLGCPHAVCGLAAADGARVGTTPGSIWMQLTPDGGATVVDRGSQVSLYDTRTGRRRWTSPARPGETVSRIAASDRWIAVLTQSVGPARSDHTLVVYRRADGAKVWSHASRPGKYLQYIAAGGDLVAYFDSGDAAVHAVHLPDGADVALLELHEGFIISPDASGSVPAVPDGPPAIYGDYVVVTRFRRDFVYRVRPR